MPRTISDILGCPSPVNVREPNDFYRTPWECTQSLIEAEGNLMPPVVWDPCCGEGDICRVLEPSGRKVISSDLVDRGYGEFIRDFLTVQGPFPEGVGIVANPPFKHAEAMLKHAADIGIEYVAFLHKAHWLNAAERGRMIENVWCPARCYLLTWRPDFTGQGGATMDCNWYVFDRKSLGLSGSRATCGSRRTKFSCRWPRIESRRPTPWRATEKD
jgi:hypothetical protein